MALTKIDVVQNISDQLGTSKRDSTRIVESVFEIMKEQLAKGGMVKISGFGNFVVRSKKARKGRNPHTGAECEIAAKKVLTFKSSQILRKALNKNNESPLDQFQQSEIILKIGSAGGSLTLLGFKSPDGQWDFFLERNEATMIDLMPEEDREGFIPVSRTPYMHSIEEALLSLGEYPWFEFEPMEIHPEFHDKILAEVKRLGGKSAVERWKEDLKRGASFQKA